jgi:hypothetical protein
MIIPFFNKSSKLSKVILLAMLYIFCVLLGPTNSRSGILFLIVGALFAVNLIPRRLVYGSRLRRVFVLAVPLLIAILVSGFSGTALHTSLNVWSQTKFHKPIFNGRDEIWQYGFTILNNHLLFGAGSMDLYNWHNSAITCLTAFGVIGYILWICSFENIFGKAVEWLDDFIYGALFTAVCRIGLYVILSEFTAICHAGNDAGKGSVSKEHFPRK